MKISVILILGQRVLHLDFRKIFCNVALDGRIKKQIQQEKILVAHGEDIHMAMILMIRNRLKRDQVIVNV